jgi:Flp pilus assembly protein TadG
MNNCGTEGRQRRPNVVNGTGRERGRLLTPAGGKKRKAAAVVEFAVAAPVLVTLVFGMIEFGRVMMVEQELTNAAREGCRAGVLAGGTTSAVTSVVTNYLANSGVPLSNPANQITVSPDPSTALAGTAITVTVSVPFSAVSWLPVPMFMGNSTLTASVVMRKET